MQCRIFVLYVGLFWLHCFGVYLFCKGFLLTRTELHDRASCDAGAALPHGPCVRLPVRPRKVIWLIIDALRIDFAAPIDNAGSEAGLGVGRTGGLCAAATGSGVWGRGDGSDVLEWRRTPPPPWTPPSSPSNV